MAQPCARDTCDREIQESDQRMVIDQKVYHYYCGWKVKEKQKEDFEKARSANLQQK